jgi:hypothetical protein
MAGLYGADNFLLRVKTRQNCAAGISFALNQISMPFSQPSPDFSPAGAQS